MIRKAADPLGHHLGDRAACVALEMPLLGDDFGEEPVELLPVVDQLLEQVAQVPVVQHAADVEDDGLGSPFSQRAEWFADGGPLSPGAP